MRPWSALPMDRDVGTVLPVTDLSQSDGGRSGEPCGGDAPATEPGAGTENKQRLAELLRPAEGPRRGSAVGGSCPEEGGAAWARACSLLGPRRRAPTQCHKDPVPRISRLTVVQPEPFSPDEHLSRDAPCSLAFWQTPGRGSAWARWGEPEVGGRGFVCVGGSCGHCFPNGTNELSASPRSQTARVPTTVLVLEAGEGSLAPTGPQSNS